ncbi:hypothetical protein N8I74_06430 [Chitiniphilus purpureus]|uniref:Uncharacterized protein n=1 Tax=Chitiniphilus purpureus TaxID=2981137 RepID=A0ABY6DRK0_9NEIS|nr:hypothetical protein [Chitiniphilus sp. CD1]UXY16652.1 hypothetical protein N8I74_06430 [Chitiniphilus sp. CD1]
MFAKLIAVAVLGGVSAVVQAEPLLRVGVTHACPTAYTTPGQEAEGFLETILIGVAVDVAANLAGSLISSLGDYLTQDSSLTLNGLYPVKGFYVNTAKGVFPASQAKCVWVAVADKFTAPSRDEYGTEIETEGARRVSPEEGAALIPSLHANIPHAAVELTGLAATPVFYYEGEIELSPDNTAWRLVTKKLFYPKFIEEAGLFHSQTRDFGLTLEYSKPAADKPFAIFSFNQSAMAEGSLNGKAGLAFQSGWMPLPEAAPPSDKNLKLFFPVNLKAQFVETRKPNVLSKAVGNALKSNKDKAVSAVKDETLLALSKDARITAKGKSLDEVEVALVAYTTAQSAAKTAYDDYQAAVAAKDATKTANALNAANAAYVRLAQAENNARAKAAAAGIPFTEAGHPGPLPK